MNPSYNDWTDSCNRKFSNKDFKFYYWDVSYLENSFWKTRFLRELLQIFGVGVVVDGEVRLHGPQLVVLEGGAHPLGPRLAGQAARTCAGTTKGRRHVQIVGIEICKQKVNIFTNQIKKL